MGKILLKNGRVVSGLKTEEKDILINGSQIEKIFGRGEFSGGEGDFDEVIDCSGKMILPGLIDVHVHFRVPGEEYKEDWETGSMAAVSGGVTMVLDMPNNKPPTTTVGLLEAKKKLIDRKSLVNYGLYIGYDGKNISEVKEAEEKNLAIGVKVYLANSTGNMWVGDGGGRDGGSGGVLEDLLLATKLPVVVHAEDEQCIAECGTKVFEEYDENTRIPPHLHSQIRAKKCAVKAVERVCELAKKCWRGVHIAHVSTEEEVSVISKYREYGVTCEAAPHHLTFSVEDYEKFGNLLKVNPPIREKKDVEALWKALKFGEIDIVATDHAPHTFEEKMMIYKEVPSGVPGVETLLPWLLDNVNKEKLNIEDVVKLCCENPAKIFKISKKGKILEGYDADLVIVDMNEERKVDNTNLHTKCGWSLFDGMSFMGWPTATIVNGKIVYFNKNL